MPCRLTQVKGHASIAGLKSGDRLYSVNDENVESLSHAQVVTLITKAPGGRLLLSISPGGDEYYTTSTDEEEEASSDESVNLASHQQGANVRRKVPIETTSHEERSSSSPSSSSSTIANNGCSYGKYLLIRRIAQLTNLYCSLAAREIIKYLNFILKHFII